MESSGFHEMHLGDVGVETQGSIPRAKRSLRGSVSRSSFGLQGMEPA
jgi:hypothetical protein